VNADSITPMLKEQSPEPRVSMILNITGARASDAAKQRLDFVAVLPEIVHTSQFRRFCSFMGCMGMKPCMRLHVEAPMQFIPIL